MKKILFICAAALLKISLCAQETETDNSYNYNYIIKVSPFRFFQSTFQVGVEKQFSSPSAIVLMPSVTYNEDDNGIGIEFQYKNYVINKVEFNKSSYHRYYVGCYGMYKYFDYKDENGHNAGGVGILAGINRVFSNRFHLDLYVGGGIRTSDGISNDTFGVTSKGIVPRIGLELGVNY